MIGITRGNVHWYYCLWHSIVLPKYMPAFRGMYQVSTAAARIHWDTFYNQKVVVTTRSRFYQWVTGDKQWQ